MLFFRKYLILASVGLGLFIAHLLGLDPDYIVKTMIVEGYTLVGLNALLSLYFVCTYKGIKSGLLARIALIAAWLLLNSLALVGHKVFFKHHVKRHHHLLALQFCGIDSHLLCRSGHGGDGCPNLRKTTRSAV